MRTRSWLALTPIALLACTPSAPLTTTTTATTTATTTSTTTATTTATTTTATSTPPTPETAMKLPATRPDDLTLHFESGSPRHERLIMKLANGTAQFATEHQGSEVARVERSLSAADFDAVYAIVVDADLGRLLQVPKGPMLHDYDGPSLDVRWGERERLALNESGFRYNDPRFSTVTEKLRAWALSQMASKQ